MSDKIKDMIAKFKDECSARGHHFTPSPFGGEYCQACGATRPTPIKETPHD